MAFWRDANQLIAWTQHADECAPETIRAMDANQVKPVADATKAVAETAGKALDMVSAVGRFSARLIGDALEQGGGMLSDQVKYWRKMRLAELEAKFNAACEARGLNPDTLRPMSLGQTVQVLEAASLEESDEVQDLWAELLANAVDPESGISLKKMYVTLLRDLGPAEAALLDLLGQFGTHEATPQPNVTAQNVFKLVKETEAKLNALAEQRWRKFSHEERRTAVSNLRRLGCIAPHIKALPYMSGLLTQVSLGGSRRDVVSRLDEGQFRQLLEWIVGAIAAAGGGSVSSDELESRANFPSSAYPNIHRLNVPETNLRLTPIGSELVSACSSPKKAQD